MEEEQAEETVYNRLVIGMQASIAGLEDTGRIQDAMQISRFIDPVEEELDDNDIDIVEHIVNRYSEREQESDEEEPPLIEPKTLAEAFSALRDLRTYEEQQEDGDSELIQHLNRQERVLKERSGKRLHQGKITSYFT